MSELATRESLLAKQPRKTKEVTTPNRGTVRVRSLSELDLQNIQAANTNKNGSPNLEKSKDTRLRMIVAAVVDAEDRLLLTHHDIADMRSWDVADVNAVYEAIASLSGVTADTLEDSEKNSVPGPDAGSPSA